MKNNTLPFNESQETTVHNWRLFSSLEIASDYQNTCDRLLICYEMNSYGACAMACAARSTLVPCSCHTRAIVTPLMAWRHARLTAHASHETVGSPTLQILAAFSVCCPLAPNPEYDLWRKQRSVSAKERVPERLRTTSRSSSPPSLSVRAIESYIN